MSFLKPVALAAAVSAFVGGSAQAIPYTITDTAGVAGSAIQSAYSQTTGTGQNRITTNFSAINYTYTHNILDAGYTAGDEISSVLLSVTLRDGNDANGIPGNQDPENGTEWPRIEFNLSGILEAFAANNNIGANDTFDFDLVSGDYADLAATGNLQSTGQLTVTLRALQQSMGQRSGYFFGSSLLTVTADNGVIPVEPVPAPAALALFGLGVLGVGFARRRKA